MKLKKMKATLAVALFAQAGVDIGELNRILLEKVEELTLYILQLKKEIAEIKVSE